MERAIKIHRRAALLRILALCGRAALGALVFHLFLGESLINSLILGCVTNFFIELLTEVKEIVMIRHELNKYNAAFVDKVEGIKDILKDKED